MNDNEICAFLKEEETARLDVLWSHADAVRKKEVGNDVHLRGLLEISSYCVRQCKYCGLRAPNREAVRYRMTQDEILQAVGEIVDAGYGTVVLQAGEDPALTKEWVAGLVKRIKADTGLAVTLSLGEMEDDKLKLWRDAGADRYLLRFETSDTDLYRRIHPPKQGKTLSERVAILKKLYELGYETGSGVMVGIPGQTYASLARDIALFRELGLHMIGVGPFLPHPATPLGKDAVSAGKEQVPATDVMVYKVLALTRLLCPRTNIPATTALSTVNRTDGRKLGLLRGANVIMPNFTPLKYRKAYDIYPDKACSSETGIQSDRNVRELIVTLGRTVGRGRGDSPAFMQTSDERS